MADLLPWLMFGIALVAMSTLIGILLWYTGLTESNRNENSICESCCDTHDHDL